MHLLKRGAKLAPKDFERKVYVAASKLVLTNNLCALPWSSHAVSTDTDTVQFP